MHETGVTMVQAPKNVVSEKGVKQFSAITSTERSELLALICSISAIGIRKANMRNYGESGCGWLYSNPKSKENTLRSFAHFESTQCGVEVGIISQFFFCVQCCH